MDASVRSTSDDGERRNRERSLTLSSHGFVGRLAVDDAARRRERAREERIACCVCARSRVRVRMLVGRGSSGVHGTGTNCRSPTPPPRLIFFIFFPTHGKGSSRSTCRLQPVMHGLHCGVHDGREHCVLRLRTVCVSGVSKMIKYKGSFPCLTISTRRSRVAPPPPTPPPPQACPPPPPPHPSPPAARH